MARYKKHILAAFGATPKDGGTFTFYRTLRPALLNHGIELRCVSVGSQEARLWDPAFADEGCMLLAEHENDLKTQAQAFEQWCTINNIMVVIGSNSLPILSALPHLPQNIRVIARCANAFEHGYKITLSCRPRLVFIIATTPRLKQDLIQEYGVQPNIIRLIPNGIAPELFEETSLAHRGKDKSIRLGFLGRLEHNQKGVLFLPEIIRRLDQKGIDFTFQIAGKGVHQKALERQLRPYIVDGRVALIGVLPPALISDFLNQVDIFIFSSQFEGCPNALLEAMMAGCAPVAFQIEGITDFIIQNGVTGFICPMADCESFASRIAELAQNRRYLQQMAMAAAKDARKRFSQERTAADYARLFKKVIQQPLRPWRPLPWNAFQPDPAFAFRKKWYTVFPSSLKRVINNCLFYAGVSDRYYE